MRYASILPPKVIDLYGEVQHDSVFMALAHQCRVSPSLREFFQTQVIRGHIVMMDTGIMEIGIPVDDRVLIELAEQGVCNELILTDVFEDGEATIRASEQLLSLMPAKANRSWGNVGIVHTRPQCDGDGCWGELDYVYEYMLDSSSVDVIAFPKVLTRTFRSRGGRLGAMVHLFERFGLPSKPVHLLGIWYDCLELYQIERTLPGVVRSVDSNFAAALALSNRTVNLVTGATKTYCVIFESVEPAQFDTVREVYFHNLYMIRTLASGTRRYE